MGSRLMGNHLIVTQGMRVRFPPTPPAFTPHKKREQLKRVVLLTT